MGNLPSGEFERLLRLPVVEPDEAELTRVVADLPSEQWPSQGELDDAVGGTTPYDYADAVVDSALTPGDGPAGRFEAVSRLERLARTAEELGDAPDVQTDPGKTMDAAKIIRYASALLEPFGWVAKPNDGEQ